MTSYQIEGIVKTITELRQPKEDFKTLDVIIETKNGEYTNALAIKMNNENAEKAAKEMFVGQKIGVYFRAQSREWQGKYYTDVICTKIYMIGALESATVKPEKTEDFGDSAAANISYKRVPDGADLNEQLDDDLPF